MKLIRISDKEIEAVLDAEDMKELAVTGRGPAPADAVAVIAAAARSELGFSAAVSDCRAELVTKDDGCVIRITARGESRGLYILCFGGREELELACSFLAAAGGISSSSLYRQRGGGQYCLCVYAAQKNGEAPADAPYWFLSVSELCTASYADKTSYTYYIREHYEPVFEKNAVNLIANSDNK